MRTQGRYPYMVSYFYWLRGMRKDKSVKITLETVIRLYMVNY